MERLLNFIKTRPFTFIGTVLGLLPIFGYPVLSRLISSLANEWIILILLGVYLLPILFVVSIGLVWSLLFGSVELKSLSFVSDILGWGFLSLSCFLYWRLIGFVVDRASGKRRKVLLGIVVLGVLFQIYLVRKVKLFEV